VDHYSEEVYDLQETEQRLTCELQHFKQKTVQEHLERDLLVQHNEKANECIKSYEQEVADLEKKLDKTIKKKLISQMDTRRVVSRNHLELNRSKLSEEVSFALFVAGMHLKEIGEGSKRDVYTGTLLKNTEKEIGYVDLKLKTAEVEVQTDSQWKRQAMHVEVPNSQRQAEEIKHEDVDGEGEAITARKITLSKQGSNLSSSPSQSAASPLSRQRSPIDPKSRGLLKAKDFAKIRSGSFFSRNNTAFGMQSGASPSSAQRRQSVRGNGSPASRRTI